MTEVKAISEEIIKKLPGTRWTKGDKDRLYVKATEEEFGIVTTSYGTGRISNAEVIEWEPLEGADMAEVNGYTGKISNSKAYKLLSQEVYIDLKTGKIYKNSFSGEWLTARLQYLIIKAEKEVASEKAANTAEVAKKTKREKKLTVEQAVKKIQEMGAVPHRGEYEAILEECSVATLRVLAKATETKMGVKVLSKFKRADLLEVLKTHSQWLIEDCAFCRGDMLKSCIKDLFLIKALKSSKSEEQWIAAYDGILQLRVGKRQSVLKKALTACTKKVLVAYLTKLSGKTYSEKQKKADIVNSFMDTMKVIKVA